MVNIIGVTFKTKYFKLRKSIQFFLIKVLFYLTAALAVKYTHIVVVCKLFCTPPVIFTNIFLQFKHIYKHTFFIWIHPGGGAASPLTLSELLDGGNTLQLRAVCGREGGREGKGEANNVYSALSLSWLLSRPVFLHLSVFILHPLLSAKLERFKFYLGSETSVTALSVDNGKI